MTHERLDGWKAIAAHMNRSVRQCQRLAEGAGLPVRRVPGSRAVFAYLDELDRWLAGDAPPEAGLGEARLTSSGRHVVIPVSSPEPETVRGGETASAPSRPRGAAGRRRIAIWGAAAAGLLLVLFTGVRFRDRTRWRQLGTALTGSWTFSSGGVSGHGPGVGRFDTGLAAGPGTSVAVALRSEGTRWAGGVEIFQDDLHWTFIAISPRERAIDVQRFPSGTVSRFFVGPPVAPAVPVRLRLTLGRRRIIIAVPGAFERTLPLDPWDVVSGRLFLRVGCPGDELHDACGGTCLFRDLAVTGAAEAAGPTVAARVPESERPSVRYTLAADTIDDQLDVLIDGRRVATGRYGETIGPMVLNPFLTRGRHTLTVLLFNRKWTAAYGVTLAENGTVLWDRRCGSVGAHGTECKELGTRLGMVQELHYTFEAR